MSKYLIELNNVNLSVPSTQAKAESMLTNPARIISDFYFRRDTRCNVTLLKNISFSLKAGQRIGILGRNGAGKSTLLRLIGKIYEPSKGSIKYNAEPMGFFSTQNGILPEATGLENIYLRGLELGYSLSEIRKRVESIVTFSGLEDHLNKPVHTYSAGMKLRLAVAITFTVEPEVLLLDEWIGAGDAEFKSKITKRLNEIISISSGLMLASHNHELLKRTCSEGLVLSKGQIMFTGPIDEAIIFFRKNQLNL